MTYSQTEKMAKIIGKALVGKHGGEIGRALGEEIGFCVGERGMVKMEFASFIKTFSSGLKDGYHDGMNVYVRSNK